MKQNEKLLVYAVTGFLMVILVVAIVFGKEAPRRNSNDSAQKNDGAGASFEDFLQRTSANGKPVVEEPGSGQKQTPETTSNTGLPLPNEIVPERPLVAPPPAPTPVPAAEELRTLLGPSKVEHNYRIVTARTGDTLNKLVQRWCGSVDEYLDYAKGMNEDTQVLKAGQEVVLPWIEDSVLLTALHERMPKPATDGNAASGQGSPASGQKSPATQFQEAALTKGSSTNSSPVPAPGAVSARSYVVKAGDSLWKIAVQEAGAKGATKFIDAVKALNPDIADIDRLREKQTIKLPAKP